VIIKNKLDSPSLGFFFFSFFFLFSHGRIKVKKNLPSIKTYFLFYFIIIILYIIFIIIFFTKQMHLSGGNWVLTAAPLYLDLTR